MMFLLVYINNIVIIGNSISKIHNVIETIASKFVVKNLENLSYFLGVEVNHDKGSGLTQH